jgi:hypothetical protein
MPLAVPMKLGIANKSSLVMMDKLSDRIPSRLALQPSPGVA